MFFLDGFAKGAYEIGFCKAILEYIKKENIKAVSGASIGALNAYGFVNNRLDYLCEIWKNLEIKSAKEFFIKQDKRDIVYSYIDELVEGKNKINNNPCYIDYIKVPNILLCYENVNKEEIEIQKKLLKASISVPTLYKPVCVKDNFYVDGAFLDNTPILPLNNKDLDLIFVLRFDHSCESYKKFNKDTIFIEIVFDDDKKLKDYFNFNKHLTKKLIKEGYKKSKQVLDKIFEYGQDLNYIKSISKIFYKEAENNFIPRNGEEVVQKINKLSRLFKTECLEDIEIASDKIIVEE